MTFTVTYRGKDGAKREECIDAANRAECVAECKQRCIAPTSIREGRARASRKTVEMVVPHDGAKLMRAAILAAVVLLVVGGAWWWFSRAKAPQNAQKGDTPKRVSPAQSEKPVKTKVEKPMRPSGKDLSIAVPQNDKGTAATKNVTDVFNGVQVVSRSAMTNANGTVVEKIHTADGKSHRVTTPPKRVFENASDQLIAMAIHGANSGVGMPPLPMTDSLEADFKKSLASAIQILDDDHDEVKLIKMEVMAVRDVLKERIAQGMTVRQALEEHQDEVNNIASYNKEALNMLREIREKDGPEAANEFLKTVNEKLKEMGVKEIPPPAKRNSGKVKEQDQ